MRTMSRIPLHVARQTGFSLVELMVSLVAGLIVVGSVLAFTVSSVRANSEFTKSTKLTQELRNVNDHLVDELRRAGYDEGAMDYVASNSSTVVSPFAPIYLDETVDANCVKYAYDREPGNPGIIDLGSGEIRAMRRAIATIGGRNIGVIEVAESSATVNPSCDGAQPDYSAYPPACNTSSGWCPLSDPRVLDVQTFTVDDTAVAGVSHGIQEIPASTGFMPLRIREYRLNLTGTLVSDGTISRSVQSNVKVRSDCLRANANDCALAPTP
jgi:type II secretory pathway pseudopilin PulG